MQIYEQNKQLTPAQANDLVQWLISETRAMLEKALLQDYKIDHGAVPVGKEGKLYHVPNKTSPDFAQDSLRGYCGHAQSFMTWALQDIGYSPRCFTISKGDPKHETIPPGAEWRHVALTVDIPTTEGVKRFLLDPTFKQFCTGGEKAPGALLANSPDGEHVVETLLNKGFIQLTPAIAAGYMAAFCKGVNPFSSPTGAIDYMTRSDDVRLKAGLWPPKSFLRKKGWVVQHAPSQA